ncbi:MAG: glycosyltransferase family A protein [Phycisphaerae bacterium]
MSTAEWIVKGLCVGYAGGIASLTWQWLRARRGVMRQHALAPIAAAAEPLPSLDVVVPVKDEEGHIATCLRSIYAQEYPNLRVLVVNDRSTDRTVERVEEVRREHADLELHTIRELPAGLYGKPHAIHTLRDRLRGEYVAFVDSDLTLLPGCLRTLVDHMQRGRIDWVPLGGTPELTGFWERLIIPVCGAVALTWYDPARTNDPNWDDALGSAFMVCRRSAYEALGGHGAVIDRYDEDSELVRTAKRAGQRVEFVMGPQLFRQRFYGSLARTIRGMTRTFAGGIKTPFKLLVTIHSLNFVSLLPIGLLLILAGLRAGGVHIPWHGVWAALAGTHLAVSTALAHMVYSAAREPRLTWLHPLGALLTMWITLNALQHQRTRRPIAWRNTTYTGTTYA